MNFVALQSRHRLHALLFAPILIWIVAGATIEHGGRDGSPDSVPRYPTLGATPFPSDYPLPSPDRLAVSKQIHNLIAAQSKPVAESPMAPYQLAVPRAHGASVKMLVIPAGEFVFGSARPGEGPPCKVRVDPFWMAETEITWALYAPFYKNRQIRNKDGTLYPEAGPLSKFQVRMLQRGDLLFGNPRDVVDVISQPTPQYHDLFINGELESAPEFPAMTMTHHAASKFCQWLSAQTGEFYRLPTEAEWEYACRAGATTRYSFGNDVAVIDQYAWHGENAEFTYHRPKQKKPNAWGLYDMHGNVAEWVLDGVDPNFRSSLTPGVFNPWCIPTTRYPRIAKGGSWDHDPEDLRVTARTLSDRDWKSGEAQVPKSIWYHTDAQHVGFRIVRPLRTPTAEEMHLFWNTDWSSPHRNLEDLE